MVGRSCVMRTVDALQKPRWPSIDSGGAAVLSTSQRGFVDLSNGCGTCGEIGRYAALAVGMSAASAMGAKAIRPLVPHMYHGPKFSADIMHVTVVRQQPANRRSQ